MGRALLALLLGSALSFVARGAGAQACCAATGGTELGVVGYQQEAVLGAELGFDHALGSFDRRGDHARLSGAEADDLSLTLAGGVRPGVRMLQLHAALPLRLQRREIDGVTPATRLGLGDASLGLRATVMEDRLQGIDVGDARSFAPFLDVFAGARAPTGRGPNDSETATQADVMGDGAWALRVGVHVMKFFTRSQALAATSSYSRRFPRQVVTPSGQRYAYSPGDEIDARLAYVNVINLHWSVTLSSSVRLTLPARSDGAEVPESGARRLRVGAGLSHYLRFPSWQIDASVAGDPPLDGLSRNVPFAGLSATLGVRRSWGH